MKKIKIIAICAMTALLGTGACLGCGGIGTSTPVHVTSYVSTESTVYGTTAEVVKAVADSVVEIKTELIETKWGMQYVSSGAGSGVIVAHDKEFSTYYIVTNNHVIDGANNIRVALRSGEAYDASLVATDVRGDIAVISIKETQTLNIATWGNSDELQLGEDLIAIGNPLGSLGGTITKGILSATERRIAVGNNTMVLLQTDTAINPGNSGGGLFNMRGELIGVVNAKTSDEQVEGICFAIPANTARAIFDDLLKQGYVSGRATLGISVAQRNNVVYVTDGGNSPGGTFMRYDKIYKINDKIISSLLDYNDAVAMLTPGQSAEITVYRGKAYDSFFGQEIIFEADPTTFTVMPAQAGK